MTIDIDEAKVARNEFGLWLGWTAATTAGMLLGYLLAALIVQVIDVGLARVLVPLLAGLMVGFLQWVVLRRYLTRSTDWILNGGAAWAVGYALGLIIVQNLTGSLWVALFAYLLFGAIIGLAQWPVLQREIPNAIPWVLANMVGWALGAYLSQVVIAALYGAEPVEPLVGTAILSGVTGLVAGAVTGLVFVWIVRQPERRAPDLVAE